MSDSRGWRGAAALAAVAALCLLVAAGCSKPEESGGGPPPGGPGPGGPGGMRGGPGGPGGMRGGPRGGGAPLSANASGAEVYQAKCQFCHGANGAGARGPALSGLGSRSDADLAKVVHDGKGKMPGMASQLSDDQIKKVVAYVKQFGGK
jgi:cytochrome c553